MKYVVECLFSLLFINFSVVLALAPGQDETLLNFETCFIVVVFVFCRWDCNIQRAFYNGWKSIHGLKHQTVDNAYGFTMDMHGPTTVRRNDLTLLRESDLENRLNALFINDVDKFKVYGDSIYPHLAYITSSHRSHNLTRRQKDENYFYKSVRISIEWNYGVTANYFRYLKNINKLKLMHSDRCTEVYRVCTLLRNCHVALYGSISSSYFNLAMPENMLEMYLQDV